MKGMTERVGILDGSTVNVEGYVGDLWREEMCTIEISLSDWRDGRVDVLL